MSMAVAATYLFLAITHSLVGAELRPNNAKEGCYHVTRVPVDENGVPLEGRSPSITRQGLPLGDDKVKEGKIRNAEIRKAIEEIGRWERRYGVEPFRGNRLPSAELREVFDDGRICVEDAKLHVGEAATTWLGPYKLVENGMLEEGHGGRAIHISPDYLPEENELLAETDRVALAAILLHEAGHLQQEGWNVNQKDELELPVYSWIGSQLSLVLGDITLPKGAKSALYEAIERAARYCRDAPSLVLSLPQPTRLATTYRGPVKDVQVSLDRKHFYAMTSGSVDSWQATTLQRKWSFEQQGLLVMGVTPRKVLAADSGIVFLIDGGSGSYQKAGGAIEKAYSYVNDLKGIVCISNVFWLLHRDGVTCVGAKSALPTDVYCIASNADNNDIVMAEERGTVSYWNGLNAKRIQGMDVEVDSTRAVTSVRASGEKLFIGYAGGGVDVWNIGRKGKDGTVMRLYEHQDDVVSMAYHSGRRWLATCDATGLVAIWALDSGSLLQTAGSGMAVEFIVSGDFEALLVGELGSLAVYDLKSARMLSGQK